MTVMSSLTLKTRRPKYFNKKKPKTRAPGIQVPFFSKIKLIAWLSLKKKSALSEVSLSLDSDYALKLFYSLFL
jgi:hypothetical protein